MAGFITKPSVQIRVNIAAVAGAPSGGRLTNPQHGLVASEDSSCGVYRITGTVDELGVAGTYRVRLFLKNNARLARETWSAADGSYKFEYIPYLDKGYFLVAHDHSAPYVNAAISDFVTPEAMP